MNKTDLVRSVAEATGMTKKDTAAVVDATLDVITKALAEGEKVRLAGFGSFEVRRHAARESINPQTKDRIVIAATCAPAFKAGKALKDAVVGEE